VREQGESVTHRRVSAAIAGFCAAELLLLAGCRREAAPAATPKPAAVQARSNLLELQQGAAVVSRTGEAMLTVSPVMAIDSDERTAWITPPRDFPQTAVFALPARSRVEELGVSTGDRPSVAVSSVKFELSTDGEHFSNATALDLEPRFGLQTRRIAPAEASFVRLTLLSAKGAYAQVNTVHAGGTLLEPSRPGSIAGCWLVNGRRVRFSADGAHVAGVTEEAVPSYFEGGFDGRFYRFAWVRGREFGLAAFTVTAGRLSGIVWHEEAINAEQFIAENWIGEPAGDCRSSVDVDTVFRSYVARHGYFPLFGLRFSADGVLDETASSLTLDQLASLKTPMRLTAHDLEQPVLSQKKITSLREAIARRGVDVRQVQFVAAGAANPHREAPVPLTRAMYSSVDLELRR
jgi:hypothetical protein